METHVLIVCNQNPYHVTFSTVQFYKGKLHYVEEELKVTLEQLAHTSSERANMSSTLGKASLAIQASLQVRKSWVNGTCKHMQTHANTCAIYQGIWLHVYRKCNVQLGNDTRK